MEINERAKIIADIQHDLAEGSLTIGQAVKRLRTEVTGLQQLKFAEMCKLSLRALRQIEHDNANPTINTLNSIFRPFGMQVGIVPKVKLSRWGGGARELFNKSYRG